MEHGSRLATALVQWQISQRMCRYFAGKNQARGVRCAYTSYPLLGREHAVMLVARPMAKSVSEEIPSAPVESN